MTFFSAIYTLIISPLELFFEVVYSLAYRAIGNPGLSIIFLSLAMNFLVLPLYKRADAIQQQESAIELKLSPWVKHIKKTFKGDERTMMLQAYYRENNYKPYYALRSSLSLFLEIPFFIAAYRFLSSLEMLNGIRFGPISDLGAPDALISVFGIGINILPVLMTAINFVSSAIYTKGMPPKSKIQLYGIAIIFLAFLYKSPSGLVFYWTLNNLFSLVKNICYKVKLPKLFKSNRLSEKGLFDSVDGNYSSFYLGAFTLAIFIGLYIPSTVIASSPLEFIDKANYQSPIIHIIGSLLLSIGAFCLWIVVFYKLSNDNGKKIFNLLIWILLGVFVVDYFCFGTNFGTLNNQLQYDNGIDYTLLVNFVNAVVIIAIVAIFYLIWKNRSKIVDYVYLIIVAVTVFLSVFNLKSVIIETKSVGDYSQTADSISIPLDTEKENVVIIMLDRAISSYLPYIFYENQYLVEQYDGFTYYPNTVSFGGHTNFATPALFGGYEYTPIESNKRSTVSLEQKQNEALSVMPILFSKNGFNVTVFDPVYAGYKEVPDLSIFEDYEGINAYITKGMLNFDLNSDSFGDEFALLYRNLFCYSIFKVSPTILQKVLYCDGLYNETDAVAQKVSVQDNQSKSDAYLNAKSKYQILDGYSKATGIYKTFTDSFNVLTNLISITNITENEKGSYFVMTNDSTHEPTLLLEPSFVPAEIIDNTEYDDGHKKRYNFEGNYIEFDESWQITHYQVNAAALIQLGKWFDYLRENDIYDNTRIIVVSDHGYNLGQFDSMILGDSAEDDTMFYNSLLLIKDFGETGFKSSDEFMTIADVPTIAMDELIENPINPLTNKKIAIDNNQKSDVSIICSDNWNVNIYNGNTFDSSVWYHVSDNIFDKSNWEKEIAK